MARKAEPTQKPKNDAYTGMLVISLGAMILGSVLLFVDYSRYSEKNPPAATKPVDGNALRAIGGAGVPPVVVPPVVPEQPKDKDAKDKDKDKDK